MHQCHLLIDDFLQQQFVFLQPSQLSIALSQLQTSLLQTDTRTTPCMQVSSIIMALAIAQDSMQPMPRSSGVSSALDPQYQT